MIINILLIVSGSFCAYRFKPSSERRRHPDLAGSAKPGLSSHTRPGQAPPPGPGGGRKTKAPFKKNPLQKGFQKRAPPPPEFKQPLLRGGVGGKTAKIVSPLALR